MVTSSSLEKLRSILAQLGDSTAELTKMPIESELTIGEHCDSLRLKVDIARETALENIHAASNTLLTEIDTYERECLSSWRSAKESTEHVVEDVSKRVRAFIVEQHAYLQRVQERDDELTSLHLDEANKLAQELNNRKKELTASMFGSKHASFNAFPGFDDVSLGELTFTDIALPFKQLANANTDLKPVDIRIAYDYVLPLEQGQHIVAFTFDNLTKMSCFDRHARLLGIENIQHHVKREHVAYCGPNQFAVCHYWCSPQLSIYDWALKRLRSAGCKNFSSICCNSKFVFGLWDTSKRSHEKDRVRYHETNSNRDDDDNNNDEQYSRRRIQVHHLDSLKEAFGLRVPAEYTIEQILADEHRVVAMSRLEDSEPPRKWFMSIFELATCKQRGDDISSWLAKRGGVKTVPQFFLAERHIELNIEPLLLLPRVFLFDSWLVVPLKNANELVWFDKNGTRSETSTEWDSRRLKDIYSSGSSLFFTQLDGKLLLKR